jgi:hypothetical protein
MSSTMTSSTDEAKDARIKELEKQLEISQHAQAELSNMVAKLQRSQSSFIAEEELLTNNFTKKLNDLQHDKQVLAQQVEEEEEMLTNKLTLQMEKLKHEAQELERTLIQSSGGTNSNISLCNNLRKQLTVHRDQLDKLKERFRRFMFEIVNILHSQSRSQQEKEQIIIQLIDKERNQLSQEDMSTTSTTAL